MAVISDEAAVNHIHTCVRITDDKEYEHSSVHDNWLYLVILQMSGKKLYVNGSKHSLVKNI